MAKTTSKTTENAGSVSDFIKAVPDLQKQKDSFALIEIMKEQSGFEPKMWGPAIVGFGSYHYTYESGRQGDAPLVGFSPRKTELALYFASNFDRKEEMLNEFGKHKTGKACIYVKRLEDINIDVLKKIITNSIQAVRAKYE